MPLLAEAEGVLAVVVPADRRRVSVVAAPSGHLIRSG
jgi:hypothetical protein